MVITQKYFEKAILYIFDTWSSLKAKSHDQTQIHQYKYFLYITYQLPKLKIKTVPSRCVIFLNLYAITGKYTEHIATRVHPFC